VGVQVFLAAELAAPQAGNIQRLRALEHHRDRDLLRGRGLAHMAAVAWRGVIAIGKGDETHLTFGGHEELLDLVMSLNRCAIGAPSYPVRGNPVAVAGRLRDDEEARVLVAAVENLMRCLCGDVEAHRWREPVLVTIEFDDEFAGQHVEELCRTLVEVTLLGGTGRHALFDDADGVSPDEVPTVA
jgi:hypothetical protein